MHTKDVMIQKKKSNLSFELPAPPKKRKKGARAHLSHKNHASLDLSVVQSGNSSLGLLGIFVFHDSATLKNF
jgi:hypothetical protein